MYTESFPRLRGFQHAMQASEINQLCTRSLEHRKNYNTNQF